MISYDRLKLRLETEKSYINLKVLIQSVNFGNKLI